MTRVSCRVVCEQCRALGRKAPTEVESFVLSAGDGWARGQMLGHRMYLCGPCIAGGLPDWWPDETGTRFHWEVT
jgi:hypothetical protein